MVIIWLFVLMLINKGSCQHNDDEIRLREEILVTRKHDHLSRPVQNSSQSLRVNAVLLVNHIQELNEKKGILTINGYMFVNWRDFSFRWNPGDFGNLREIHFPSENLWLPDLHLLNSAKASDNRIFGKCDVFGDYNGNIFWFPPITASSICDLDFTWFPMDEHSCKLIFGSWLYDGSEINLSVDPFDVFPNLLTLYFDEHNEWEILKTAASKSNFLYETYDWPIITFQLTFRRRVHYYYMAIIVPCVVALLLTLATFWLHPASPEKFTLCSVTNVYLTLYLAHLYWVIPRNTTSIPGIVILFGNMSFFAGLSLILAVVTNTLSRTSRTQTFSPFLHNIIHGWLTSALCLQMGKPSTSTIDSSDQNLQANGEKPTNSKKKNSTDDWLILAIIIDRLCFLIYCLSYFIIFLVAFV